MIKSKDLNSSASYIGGMGGKKAESLENPLEKGSITKIKRVEFKWKMKIVQKVL